MHLIFLTLPDGLLDFIAKGSEARGTAGRQLQACGSPEPQQRTAAPTTSRGGHEPPHPPHSVEPTTADRGHQVRSEGTLHGPSQGSLVFVTWHVLRLEGAAASFRDILPYSLRRVSTNTRIRPPHLLCVAQVACLPDTLASPFQPYGPPGQCLWKTECGQAQCSCAGERETHKAHGPAQGYSPVTEKSSSAPMPSLCLSISSGICKWGREPCFTKAAAQNPFSAALTPSAVCVPFSLVPGALASGRWSMPAPVGDLPSSRSNCSQDPALVQSFPRVPISVR